MPTATAKSRPWIPAAEAIAVLGRSGDVLRRLASQGVVRAHRVGNGRPLYLKTDLQRLALPEVDDDRQVEDTAISAD